MVEVDHGRREAPGQRDGPDALIEEARRRTRRRRVQRVTVGVLALAAALVGYALAGGGGAPRVVQESTNTPFANLRAFAGRGELAFVSRGGMWALDGERGTLRRLPVPAGWTPYSPELSRDGRWLAYLTAASTTVDPTR